MSWYLLLKTLLGAAVRAVSTVRVDGLEHVPDDGPFMLIPNHQSVLDPIYIQSAIHRNDLYTLTKSTQFRGAAFRWILPRVNAFPVRRYRVDPQAVRVALRHLDDGHGVCLYPEGERCWDGSLGPLRRGSIRLVLKAGVPIVPCWIEGSYDVWPRWSRRMSRKNVRIRFGRPLHFGRHDDRASREAALERARRRIVQVLLELRGPSGPPPTREPGRRERAAGPEDPGGPARPRPSTVTISSHAAETGD